MSDRLINKTGNKYSLVAYETNITQSQIVNLEKCRLLHEATMNIDFLRLLNHLRWLLNRMIDDTSVSCKTMSAGIMKRCTDDHTNDLH